MAANPSKFPPRLILTVGGLLLLVLVLHVAGVSMLRYLVEKELHPALPRGTYIGDVHLNLFTGSLKVENFELRNDGEVRMRFNELAVKVSPWRLVAGTLHIQEASLRQAYMRIDRREDGSFDLGLPDFAATDPQSPPDDELPDLRIDQFALERITLEYHDGEFASSAYIDAVNVGPYAILMLQQQVPVAWKLRWDGRRVEGDAEITLDGDEIAAAGGIATELLDIGRAQQLARLAPVAQGEIGYRGTFAWKSPQLELAGRLDAPQLDYVADGQRATLRGAQIPQLHVALQTAPTIDAKLMLPQPIDVAALNWQATGQGAEVEMLNLAGEVRFVEGRNVSTKGLVLNAGRLAWSDAARKAELRGVNLKTTLTQALDGEASLPVLSGNVSARGLDYDEKAQALSVRLGDLVIGDLALTADEGQPGRGLSANLLLGAGKVARAGSEADWSALNARLGGRIADSVQLTSTLTVNGLKVADPSLPHGPLTLQQVMLDALELGARTGVGSLRLRGVSLPAEQRMTALRIAGVDLDGANYSERSGVALGEIVIDSLQTGVLRDKAGAWRHVMSGGAPGAVPPARKPAKKNTAAAGNNGALSWRVAGVRVKGDSHITVADALNPGMQPVRYDMRTITVGALSSGAPERDTPFEITLAPDQYSEFSFKGVARPLATEPYLKAEGHLHGFGLSTVNGLVANDLGHRFLEGQLDDDFTITIDENRLDMANALALAGLQVEEIEGKEGPPLSTAIALLEDRDGNIKLEVPVAGDLSDPEFRVLGALNPIIMKAVAGTAALAIQPLGSVLLVGTLLADQALKVTFEPVVFDVGSTELNAGARKYLGQLANKLADKPKLAVRVCGVVADAERKKNKQGKYADTSAEVLAIAQQRADAARAFLTISGVAKKQLRRCRPSFDAKADAQPRVDIKF